MKGGKLSRKLSLFTITDVFTLIDNIPEQKEIIFKSQVFCAVYFRESNLQNSSWLVWNLYACSVSE